MGNGEGYFFRRKIAFWADECEDVCFWLKV
jgi:hypothetical protein